MGKLIPLARYTAIACGRGCLCVTLRRELSRHRQAAGDAPHSFLHKTHRHPPRDARLAAPCFVHETGAQTLFRNVTYFPRHTRPTAPPSPPRRYDARASNLARHSLSIRAGTGRGGGGGHHCLRYTRVTVYSSLRARRTADARFQRLGCLPAAGRGAAPSVQTWCTHQVSRWPRRPLLRGTLLADTSCLGQPVTGSSTGPQVHNAVSDPNDSWTHALGTPPCVTATMSPRAAWV